jgi:mannonate dehydratase
MPILDWTRTDLEYELPDGSRALRFDQIAAAFELHILKRPGRKRITVKKSSVRRGYFKAMSEADIDKLTRNIIAGLPGAEGLHLDQFRARLAEYDHIDKAQLRENMAYFLRPSCRYAKRWGPSGGASGRSAAADPWPAAYRLDH